jgi:hypothetical protein
MPTIWNKRLRSRTAAQATPSNVNKPKPKKSRRRQDPWAPKRKPNPHPKPRAPPPTHATCRICLEEQSTDQFPTWISKLHRRRLMHSMGQADVPLDCVEHLGRNPNRRKIKPVCKICIGRTMAARLDIVGAREVGSGCLEPGCNVPWSWDLIMKYLPAGEALEKYNLGMFEVWKQDPANTRITCIAPECAAIALPDETAPGFPQVSCNTCAVRFCARCLVPWHTDVTCTEYKAKHVDEQMTDTEKETLKLMQIKDGKRCPNCFLVIEKDGGCDSMFCVGCHKYFNWATAGKMHTC